MRLLLELKARSNFLYDLKYYHKLQGFIYSLIKDTPYKKLHDKKGYKFFTFSNIFPVTNTITRGSNRYLLIASPDKFFIKSLKNKLDEVSDIKIGEMNFYLENIKTLSVKLKVPLKVVSATPIVIRIPKYKYELYNIPTELRDRKYVYWNSKISIKAFIEQIQNNLIKKYAEFYKKKITLKSNLFEFFRFKKEVCVHIVLDGKEYKNIGSIWEFLFTSLKGKKKIIKFALDTGLGERNSMGFGFINIVRE